MKNGKVCSGVLSKSLVLIIRVCLALSILILSTHIRVPIGVVPITLQTLAVCLIGTYLSVKENIALCICWTLLPILGVPILKLWSPTFGYIIGMMVSMIGMRYMLKNLKSVLLSYLLSNIIIYTLGTIWLMCFVGSFEKAFNVGVKPFILWDILKSLTAYFITRSYNRYKEE